MRVCRLSERAAQRMIHESGWDGVEPAAAQAMMVRQLKRPVRFGSYRHAPADRARASNRSERIDVWRYRNEWYVADERASPQGILAAVTRAQRAGGLTEWTGEVAPHAGTGPAQRTWGSRIGDTVLAALGVLFYIAPAVAFVAVIGLAIALQGETSPQRNPASFAEHLGQYTASLSRAKEARQLDKMLGRKSDAPPAVIQHKIVLVELERNRPRLAEVSGIPGELVASKPEEVGTLVFLRCRKDLLRTWRVRIFRDSRDYVWECRLTLVDASAQRIIWALDFSGSEPDEIKPLRVGDRTGSRPTEDGQIGEYLGSFPRG